LTGGVNHPTASRPPRRTLRPGTVNLVIVTATIIGALVYQSASSSASSVVEPPRQAALRPLPQTAASSAPAISDVPRGPGGGRTTDDDGAVTEDDGALLDGVTVFDDGHSGVGNLDPELLRALREAAKDAAGDDIDLFVNSGWRSPAYQEQLFQEAVARYGSEREAARWVASPDTSAHVSGDAVDIGPSGAAAWLSEHGARYGLCQIYRNESWHYELRPAAIDHGCPPMYADSAHDPNLQR
jgi:zinc D-Ala-D-Ala carboxypeptidase